MHLSLPLFYFTQWKDKCTSYLFTTKKLTHSMCQFSLVVKYIKISLALEPSGDVFILLINVKMPTNVGILTLAA